MMCITGGGGGQYRIRKKWNLYIFLQRNALIDIKISINYICYTNMARYPNLKCFLYFMNEKINKNAKVEKFTIMLAIAVRLMNVRPIRLLPLVFFTIFHGLIRSFSMASGYALWSLCEVCQHLITFCEN